MYKLVRWTIVLCTLVVCTEVLGTLVVCTRVLHFSTLEIDPPFFFTHTKYKVTFAILFGCITPHINI